LATAYERKILKDVEALFLENDRLKAEIARIEARTAAKYQAIIDRLEAKIDVLEQKCAAQEKRIAILEAENDRLRRQLNNDSNNSSNPPSSDIKPNSPNEFNGRTSTDKKSGGQMGHSGKYLSRECVEEKIARGLISHKIVNHGNPQGNYVSKYVLDIGFTTTATEHRFYDGEEIPRAFQSEVQYGSGLKAFVATLAGQGFVSSSRIVEMLKAFTNGAIELSDGTVYNFLSEFDNKVKDEIKRLTERLLNNEILHVDETGARINAQNMFFRNYSDQWRVLFTANKTKGKTAVDNDNILPRFAGCLVHDHNTINYNYGTNNAECNVHLLRYLKANSENTQNLWSAELAEFLVRLNISKELAQKYGTTEFNAEYVNNLKNRFNEIVDNGFEQAKCTASRYFKAEELKLLRRLKKYVDNHLLFAVDFKIPFDNNLSERDLRLLKTKQKVSGCFRTLKGARIFSNLMSVIKTAIKQSLSPFVTIKNAFNGTLCLA